MTPPKPFSITTGILPAGQCLAPSIVTAMRAASFAVCSASICENSSNPTAPPGPKCPLCFSDADDATASMEKRLRIRQSSAHMPSVFATNISCVTSKKEAFVCVIRLSYADAAADAAKRRSAFFLFSTLLGNICMGFLF